MGHRLWVLVLGIFVGTWILSPMALSRCRYSIGELRRIDLLTFIPRVGQIVKLTFDFRKLESFKARGPQIPPHSLLLVLFVLLTKFMTKTFLYNYSIFLNFLSTLNLHRNRSEDVWGCFSTQIDLFRTRVRHNLLISNVNRPRHWFGWSAGRSIRLISDSSSWGT